MTCWLVLSSGTFVFSRLVMMVQIVGGRLRGCFGDHSDQRKPLHFRPIGSTTPSANPAHPIQRPRLHNQTQAISPSFLPLPHLPILGRRSAEHRTLAGVARLEGDGHAVAEDMHRGSRCRSLLRPSSWQLDIACRSAKSRSWRREVS